jgi:hypothetical protein
MSILHKQSYECAKSELDLFSIPPTRTSMETSKTVVVKPKTTLNESNIRDFEITGAKGVYIDLSQLFLSVVCSISGAEGVETTVAPCNLFLHSLFKSVDISLNGTCT